MELLTLNLHTPLEWSRKEAGRAGIIGIQEAADAISNAPEAAEAAMSWDWDTIVDTRNDDGPRARRPLPSPASAAASGFSAKPSEGTAGESQRDIGDTIRMEPGRYLFVQIRAPVMAEGSTDYAEWLADTLEWFAREAWWTESGTTGPLLVRLVREDGKTAVQIVRTLA